jgi:CHAT domain-containing protein/predicted negative regulator of RcsB-dependent stress response
MRKTVAAFKGRFVVAGTILTNVLLLFICPPIPLADTPVQSAPLLTADRNRQAETLYREAMSLVEQAKYRPAWRKLVEALQLWRTAQRSERAIQVLLEVGNLHKKTQRWQDALWCFEQLMKLPKLPVSARIESLVSIAQVYTDLNQLDPATKYYQQALGLAQDARKKPAEIEALLGLATIRVKKGQSNRALKLLEQIRQQDRLKHETEVAILYLRGTIYREQRRTVEASEAVQRLLMLSQQAGNVKGQVQALCALSGLSLSLGRKQEALERAEEARQLAHTVTASEAGESRWRAWLAMARAQQALGRTQEALKSYSMAAGIVEGQRLGRLFADELRIASLAERQAPHQEWVDLLMETGRVEDALNRVEFSRSRSTLQLLGNEAESNGDPTRRERFIFPATLKEVQEALLRPTETLIEFFLAEPRSFVWLVTPKEFDYAVLPGKNEIETQVREYLRVLTAKPFNRRAQHAITKQRKPAASLFEMLIGPLAKRIMPEQRLVIVPDGLLHYLPFETLVRDERYVIQDHELSYTPSASVLRLLRQPNGKTRAATEVEFLAFGDPVFGRMPTTATRKARNDDLNNALQDALAASGFRLPPLPNTREEVEAISQLIPPERRRILVGKEATEDALKREPLAGVRWLHLATHGLVDEQEPARSGVVLTLDNDPAEDGFLEVSEIRSLDLKCDLVVLSACQTGRGQLVTGEAVIGMSRAFLLAGARSVAVTLWNVSDGSTTGLMKRFYERLVAGQDASAALRRAKLELIESRSVLRHPHYWAAFVLVGNAVNATKQTQAQIN